MFLEIISPEAKLYSGEVEAVTVPGVLGEFQVLTDHAPIISLLGKGEVKIKGAAKVTEEFESLFNSNEKKELVLSINSGTLELNKNKIILLAD